MKQIIFTVFLLSITASSFSQPQLWGITAKGGTDSVGNIFKIKGDGTGFQSVHSFTGMVNKGSNPSLLCEGTTANKVYGIANAGGANNLGTLFSYDYTTNVCTVLKQLDSTTGFDCKGGLTLNTYNNKLYGLMKYGGSNNGGTLFEYNESTNSFTVLLNFQSFYNGTEPVGALTAVGSILYGCTSQGTSSGFGGVFSYDLSQPSYLAFAHAFNFVSIPNTGYETDGFIAKSVSGKLYVCTKRGLMPPFLDPIQGALLQIDPNNSNAVTPLVYFDATVQGSGAGSLIYLNDGNEKLLGRFTSGGTSGAGSIFEMNLTTNSFSIKYNFSYSNTEGYYSGGVLGYNNLNYLLGFTRYGGAFGDGTLYKYNIATATIDTLMSLQNNVTGNANYDEGGLTFLPSTNKWIGGLQNGSTASGNIVELNYPASNQLTTLANFNAAPNGLYPQASLVAKDGYLYGTTIQGGNSPSGTHSSYGDYIGYGTMFKYHPQSSTFTKLLDFNDANGSFPSSDLIADDWGSIYGTTMYGGSGGLGTIFKYDIGNNTLETMYDFSFGGGNTPIAGLAAYNGLLYGVTSKGGISDAGAIFSIQPISNVFNIPHYFDTTVEGGRPIGKLFLASNNKFYGFTSMGGSKDAGSLFEFDPSNNNFTKIADMDSATIGSHPHGSFTELNNKLYATITNGGGGDGVLLEYDLFTNTITQYQSINGYPKGTPLKASDNKLYWLTSSGGINGKGSIISYDAGSNSISSIASFDGSNGAYPALSSLTEYAPCPTLNPPSYIHGLTSYYCEGTTQMFYADTVTTAQSFNWTVPNDWNIISGQGTDTIHVTIGASSGNIEVNVYDGCSTSANISFFQGVIVLPSIPAAISGGAANSCPSLNQSYSTLNNGGADSFTWVVPTGWQIVSGQGTANVTLTTNSIAANDTIKVKGNNVCGSSDFTTKAVHVYSLTPPQPEAIIGNASPCNGYTTYSIAPVDGASSYEWSIPSGWTGSSTGTSIYVKVNSNLGDISVKAVGSCDGSKSIPRTLTITRAKLPTPERIIGDSIVCVNTNNVFSVPAVPGATSYSWTLPTFWSIISGQGTNTITVQPSATATAGSISVVAQSNCALPSNPSIKFLYPDGDYLDINNAWVGIHYRNSNGSTSSPIYGKITVQPNTVLTYSSLALPNALSYTWQVPNGWTILSGQGTTSISVQSNNNSGSIKLTAQKSCNGKVLDTLPVQVTTPIAAGTPVLLGTSFHSISLLGGSIFTMGADGSGYEVLHPFWDSSYSQPLLPNGSFEKFLSVMGKDGKIYALVDGGDRLVLAMYNPTNNKLLKKVRIDEGIALVPSSAICAANDSSIYLALSLHGSVSNGAIASGTAHSNSEKVISAVYRYNPIANTLTRELLMLPQNNKQILSFQSMMQASDGNLYGLASYKIEQGDTVKLGNELFRYNTAAHEYTVLNSFSDTAKGVSAFGQLVQGSNGLLYGITSAGGSNNRGTLYSYSIPNNTITKLHDFDAICEVNLVEQTSKQLFMASNNKLYGAVKQLSSTNNTYLFEFDLIGNAFSYKQRIDNLSCQLMEPIAGKLYGTTSTGFINSDGSVNNSIQSSGTLFEFDLATGILTPKQRLVGYISSTDATRELGQNFMQQYHDSYGNIYGTTTYGSYGGFGAIYKYTIASNAISLAHSFGFSKGRNIIGKLVRASNGKFYGASSRGNYDDGIERGNSYGSSIFEYDPSTKSFEVKQRIKSDVGWDGVVTSDLTLASNCKMYGFTGGIYSNYYGGSGNANLFEYDPISNQFTIKQPFSSSIDALRSPIGNSMVEYMPGKLLGVAIGSGGNGAIFEYDIATNTFTTKYNFETFSIYAKVPAGGLTKAANGKFYGIASYYRSGSNDTKALIVYEFNPYTNTLTRLAYKDGEEPNGGLIEGAYGKLYGTIANNYRISTNEIFEFDYHTNTITIKKEAHYGSDEGSQPFGITLLKASDGNMYGMNSVYKPYGPVADNRTVMYKIDSIGNNFSILHTSNGVDSWGVHNTQLTELSTITASTKYYSKATGNLNDLSTWGSNTDGTGTAPSNFTSDNKVFIIANNSSKTINANWVIGGFNTKVFVGNGTDSTALNIADGFTLTVTDKATLNVNNKGTINIAANAVLDVNNNATVNCNCNSNLTFQSTAAGTARLAPLTNGGNVYGNVKTERYIQGGYRKFRFLGHPFAYPMNLSEWTDDVDITGAITGTNANNFTPTGTNNPSAFTFTEANGNGASNDAGWNPLSSSSIASQLGIAQGIRVMIRGSKNQAGSLTGGTYTPNPVTLNMKGVLQQGDFTKELSYSGNNVAKGWNLIGNPYPSNIDWNTVTKTNVNDAVYTYRPSLNGGTYASYINGSSTNGGSNILESHVGFFVRANTNGASLTFHENDKVATVQPNTMFRNSNTQNEVHSKLKLTLIADSLQYTDEVIVRFGVDNATDNFDEQYDAHNLAGNAHDLYVLDNKENKYSIYHGSELKQWQDEDREVKLGVTVATKGKYTLQGKLLNAMSNGNIAYLKDAELNTLTAITDSINYSFSINNNQSLTINNRFSIVFNTKEKMVEPTNGLTLSPNPSTANMFVLTTGKAYKQLSIQLNDASGKTIFTKQTTGINTNQSITLQTPSLAAGTYYITATSEHGKETFKWVKL